MEDLDFRIERLVLRDGSLINNVRDGDLARYHITSAQSETILYYADHPGESIRGLANHLQITHQAARKLVDKLRQKGILQTTVSPEDRRFSRVGLTPEGQELYRELRLKGFSVGSGILAGFTATEKARLLDYLMRIEKNAEIL